MTTFGNHLTRVMYSLGDPSGSIWSRTNEVWYWLIEAIREFPILRPMQEDISEIGVGDIHTLSLPADFKEIISVEWPVDQTPPRYHLRRNRLEADFYDGDTYDIERDYESGSGWTLWMGQPIPPGEVVRVDYLAMHDTSATEIMVLTVPDQYLNILTEYCIIRAWTERLSTEISNPTAHATTIAQINSTIQHHRETYNRLVQQAVREMTTSRVTMNRRMDKHDRIY